MPESLKLGIAQYTYLWDYSLNDALKKIKAFGFHYIELMTTPPHFWPRQLNKNDRKNLRKRIERLGLEILAINPTFLDINLASPNPGFREESKRQIIEQIALGHDLGAKIIVVILGRRHPLISPPIEIIWKKYTRDCVLQCLEFAEKKGVIFGLENGPTQFIDRTELMLWVLQQVKSPWMKFVFDVANASLIEPILPGIERIKEHLIHVHLSDTDGKRWTHSTIGEGKINFSLIYDALKKINFSGVSILETTQRKNADVSISKSLKKLLSLGWVI